MSQCLPLSFQAFRLFCEIGYAPNEIADSRSDHGWFVTSGIEVGLNPAEAAFDVLDGHEMKPAPKRS